MFEAYKIAVKISLINHVSTGLLAMGKDFARTEAQAAKLEMRIKNIQSSALKGALMFAGGVGIAGLLKVPYEEAKKLAQAQADFSNLNLSAMDNAKAFGTAAANAHKTLGSTITGNIKLIQDLHTATGDLGNALALSGAYTQFGVAARVQNGGKEVDGLVSNSIKALEHRGDRVMQSQANRLFELSKQSQVYFATKGRVSPSDYFHMSQTGKMSYTLADSDFLYGPMAAMMQAKTGATAGTSQMTMLASLVGGHMTKKAIGFMRGLGLWQDQASPLTSGLKSSINNDPLVKKLVAAQGDVGIQSGGMPGWAAKLAAGNTNAFVLKVLGPAIRKKYGLDLSDSDVAMMLTQQFNRNTADNLSFWLLNQQKVAKDTALISKSNSYSGAYAAYMKSPEGAEEAASAAWKNFLAMFGTVYLPVITDGLLKIAGGLDSLSKAVTEHPLAFKALAYSLGLVAVGLGLRGGGLLLSAAFKGLGLALAFQGGAGPGGIAGGISRMALGVGALGVAVSAFLAIAYLPDIIKWAKDHSGAEKHRIPGSAPHSGYFNSGMPNPLANPRFKNESHPGIFSGAIDFLMTPMTGSKAAPPIQLNVHLDGKQISSHLVGPNTSTGTTSMNPTAGRPMPGTPALGY